MENKHQHLKKQVICGKKSDGGFDMFDFFDVNYTFKVNWIKNCVNSPDSFWYFIPQNIFKRVGGLKFLLTCNFSSSKLPIKLSKFHEQALLAWKLCFVHNFSPHKVKLWNNESILVKNKSIFFKNWHEKVIDYLCDMLDSRGNVYSYYDFMSKYDFPIVHKEFLTVVKAIPNGLVHLMKCHLLFEEIEKK